MRIPQFEAFRRQYPAASLTSDLLAIHENHYVVRGQVRLEGNLLSAAMAADSSLEAAEDRAYQRAIENLLGAPAAAALDDLPKPAPGPAALPALALVPPVNPAPDPAPAALGAEALAQTRPEPPPEQSVEEILAPSLGQPPKPFLPSPPEPPLELPFEPLAAPTPEPTAPALELLTLPEPQSPEAAALAADPVDLSDIIAQTDVELRRLGWTVDQGREFLQKTYGKRSRHDLSDQELLEFLLFLETQMPLIGR